MRRFEFVEGTSAKFWEISIEASNLHLRWGRLGTAGQSQTKSFASDAAAEKEADKLIKEKTKKGYAEVASEVPGAPAVTTAPKVAEAAPQPAPKKPAKSATARPAKAAPSAAAVPVFGSLTSKQVASVAAKLEKVTDEYKAASILDKVNIAWEERDALCWHIARHGLLDPTHPALLRLLGESADRASADEVFAVVPRLATPARGEDAVMPGWMLSEDKIVLRAQELDSGRLEALLEGATPLLRTGIQLVRGRSGATLDESDRAQVLQGLAAQEASGYGLPRIHGAAGTRLLITRIAAQSPNAREEAYPDAIDLARCFGEEGAWRAALGEAVKQVKFAAIEWVLPGLAVLPLEEMVSVLAQPHFTSDAHDRHMAMLVEMRDDDPVELARAALAIDRDAYPGGNMREQLLIHAIARMGRRGIPVPEGLESEPKWDGLAHNLPPWRGSAVLREAYRLALQAIPRERALALASPALERRAGMQLVAPILSVHYDESIARMLLSIGQDAIADADAFGTMGAPVLPLLVEALGEGGSGADYDKRRSALLSCMRAALGYVGATGGSFDATFDGWISCSTEDSFWHEYRREAFLSALRAMPEDRRIATLERLFAETKQVERPFVGVGTVQDAAFREQAARIIVERYGQVQEKNTLRRGLKALGERGLDSFRAAVVEGQPDTKLFDDLKNVFGHAPVDEIMKGAEVVEETKLARLLRLSKERIARDGGGQRIYLIERRDLDTEVPPPRAGSFSFSRGEGPGALEVPERGEAEHILTVDLEEIPELAARFGGARALSLFAPDPEGGEGWDSAILVRVPSTATTPTDGTPLTVVPINVPTAIFDYEACQDDPVLKDIRGLVFDRPGYALGLPMYIQDDESGGEPFVMQLAEQAADINLGDAGSLYVFEGATFMQCY